MQKNTAPKEVQTTENRIQEIVIGFACLSFFPLVYFVGKALMSIS